MRRWRRRRENNQDEEEEERKQQKCGVGGGGGGKPGRKILHFIHEIKTIAYDVTQFAHANEIPARKNRVTGRPYTTPGLTCYVKLS